MGTYCPLARENCKQDDCVMWRNENCLIIQIIEDFTLGPEGIAVDGTLEDYKDFGISLPITPPGSSGYHSSPKQVPKEIEQSSPEELAQELTTFANEEFPDEENLYIARFSDLFWKKKNLERWDLPFDIEMKVRKAEILAQTKLSEERQARLKKQLEEEKTELDKLVSSCVVWAKDQGLSRLTKSDVEVFLMEKEINILYQTKNALYAMSNTRLKSRR